MNTKILAAVSGGKDSMCMLDKLLKQDYDVIVAHFNHNMRGEEADRDALFVQNYCKKRNIICIVEKSEKILSSESEARKERYLFLEKCADRVQAEFIATAHTKSDNIETVLLNITRGTGIKGLVGIPEIRGRIIRPILHMTSEDVINYNKQNQIPYIEDSTNNSLIYSRNLIRHQILPLLKEINPNVVDAIDRLSQLASDDEEFFDSYLNNTSTGQERAVQSRLIRKNCPESLSFSHVDAVLNLNDGYKKIDLPGIRIIKDRGKLYFDKQVYSFDISIEKEIVNNNLIKDWIKCDSIKGELRLSTRMPGDKIKPAFRNCTKTLKSLFLENNLTQAQRNVWPILRDDEGIVWIYKIAVAERVVAHEGDRAYKITVTEK